MKSITEANTIGTKLIKVDTVPEKLPAVIIASEINKPTTPTTTPTTITVMSFTLAILTPPFKVVNL